MGSPPRVQDISMPMHHGRGCGVTSPEGSRHVHAHVPWRRLWSHLDNLQGGHVECGPPRDQATSMPMRHGRGCGVTWVTSKVALWNGVHPRAQDASMPMAEAVESLG